MLNNILAYLIIIFFILKFIKDALIDVMRRRDETIVCIAIGRGQRVHARIDPLGTAETGGQVASLSE